MSRRIVVVVEDEPLVRSNTTELFQNDNMDVVAFPDGDTAIDYVRDHMGEVAAIFTGAVLPGGTSGLELAEIVAAVCPHIAVLVTADGRRSRPAGLDPRVRYLPRPWRSDEVLATVRGAVSAAA